MAAKRKKLTFEDKFRKELSLPENANIESVLKMLGESLRREPLMVTLVWSLSGLTLRTTANLEDGKSVQQLASNLRSVAEQLNSLAFDLISKENKDDPREIPEPVVGEAK